MSIAEQTLILEGGKTLFGDEKTQEQINKEDEKLLEDPESDGHASDYIIDQESFKTPEMGDFYLGAVDDLFLQKLDAVVNGSATDTSQPECDKDGDGKNAAFYTEAPPYTTLGEKDGTYLLKVTVDSDDEQNGWLDGCTLRAKIGNTSSGSSAEHKDDAEKFQKGLCQKDAPNVTEGRSALASLTTKDHFTMQLYGMNSPTAEKWAEEEDVPADQVSFKSLPFSDAQGHYEYTYSDAAASNSDKNGNLTFVNVGDRWYQAEITKQDSSAVSFKWLVTPASTGGVSDTTKATANMLRLLKQHGDNLYILVDSKAGTNNTSTNFNYISDNNTAVEQLTKWAHGNSNGKNGWSLMREDYFARLTGSAYIKVENKWINLAKALLASGKDIDSLMADNTFVPNDNLFKNNYDQEQQTFADAYFKFLDDLDDRKKIQKTIFKKEFDELKRWTVTIGDVTLFVPPTNIRVTTTTTEERVPMLRAKGSIPKSGRQNLRTISMTIYFNDDRGINGFPYETVYPNGDEVVYYMNGLRELIAELKFVPFLPLENDYINDTLGIEAVTFNNITVQNVPSVGPKLFAAELTMTEFEYGTYIPDVVSFNAQANNNGNWFSSAFNWPVMRYYYQRFIQNGQELHKIVDANSKEYNKLILKSRTALQPMDFKSSKIKFYIADAEYLEKMLAAKNKRYKAENTALSFDDDQKQIVSDIAGVYKDLDNAIKSGEAAAYYKENIANGQFCIPNTPALSKSHKFKEFSDSRLAYINDSGAATQTNPNGTDASPDYVINQYLGLIKKQFIAGGHVDPDSISYQTNIESTGEDTYRYTIYIIAKLKNSPSSEQLDGIKENISAMSGSSNTDSLEDGEIKIPFSFSWKVTDNSTFGSKKYKGADNPLSLNESNADMKFAKFCSDANDDVQELQNGVSPDGSKWKKSVNQAMLDQLAYQPLDMGTFVVESFSASLSNRFSSARMIELGGSSPQYLGGEDTVFNVSIMTQDDKCADAFSNITDTIAFIMRRYRRVIPCCPLKVDSEFTRFFGVNEVTITNVQVSTVPNQPGVYKIDFDMRATDRTLRNREAMQMLEANNDGYKFDKAKENARSEKSIFSYFDTEKIISQAELYPDLELPTLSEMKDIGYDFIRYKFQDDRVYVDPDFYFVYLNQLQCQVVREMVLQSINNGEDGSGSYTDATGAKMFLQTASNKGFIATPENDTAKYQINQIKKAKNSRYNLNAKQTVENLRDQTDKIKAEDNESWDVCKDIKCVFMEQRYKKEYDSFIARGKSNQVEGVTQEQNPENNAKTSEQRNSEMENSVNNVKQMDDDGEQKVAAEVSRQNQTEKDGEDTSSLDDNTPENAGYAGTAAGPNQTEGKWVNQQLDGARNASSCIESFLKDQPIPYSVEDTSALREVYESQKAQGNDTQAVYDSLKASINNATEKFFTDGDIIYIFNLLNTDVTNADFLSTVKDIVFSAACAATGEKEFSSKKKSTNWYPAPDFIGSKNGGGTQDVVNADLCNTVEDAMQYATEFGCFKIKMYTRAQMQKILNEEPENPWKSNEQVNDSYYLLDRYYRYLTEDEIAQYKKGCINSPEYCTYAFLRNMLFWINNLIKNQALPSIIDDVLRNASQSEIETQLKEQDRNLGNTETESRLSKHIDFMSKNAYAVDAGKVYAATALAITDGDMTLRRRIHNRDYRALNEYVFGASVPSTSITTDDKTSLMLRKMSMSLVGVGRVKDQETAGVQQNAMAVQHARDYSERKYIEAAEDPKQFMLHSCHDMIVGDARGRMLRAFPTYYMMFIDEGRDVGSYHLHDNFYNSMSILEFTVVKDRKNPADTAMITLSNLYQSLSTENDDTKVPTSSVSISTALKTAFFPDITEQGEAAEKKRRNAAVPERLRLRPGARIHLRAGYGSSAAMLQPIFNGVIAECSAQETVEITAQGDGIELMNPIMEESEADSTAGDASTGIIQGLEDMFMNGDTPKRIMNGILTTDGGVLKSLLKMVDLGHLLGDNPFGIYHFGNKNFTSIIKSGEPTQNIFEAWAKPNWGDDNDTPWGTTDAPHITFDIFGKTVWDCANICKSVMPDFICAVAPFDMRSTLFIGAPRYYYAYSYTNINGAIQEKRKPFQQYHIYTSATDIIANGIVATSQKMKTVATGLYQVAATFNTKEQHKVGPMYVDFDIFPEYQKSMIVDTQLYGKGAPFIGAAGLNFFTSFETIDDLTGDEKGNTVSNRAIAWRMTASGLKDAMKEMYAGDMVILGDPTIKPHDRMYIMDNYEGITGQCTAKEVVHHMSVDNGFTTTVSPDLICAVDDPFESIVTNWMNRVPGIAAGMLMGGALGRFLMKHRTTFTTQNALKWINGRSSVQKAKDVIGKENIQKGIKAAKDVASTAKKDAKAGKEALETFLKKGKKGSKLVKFAAAAVRGGAAAAAVGAAGAGLAAAAIAAAPAIAGAIAVTAALYAIGSAVDKFYGRFLRELQVMTVYPLKRYGKVWTAGMAGSKGCIYGSPSYKQQGTLTSLAAKIVSNDNIFGQAIAALIGDDEAANIGAKLLNENGDADDDGNPTVTQQDFDNKLAGVSSGKQSNGGLSQDYRSLQVKPLADYSSGNDVLKSYNYYKIMDTNSFQNSPKLGYNRLISEDRRFDPYISEGFFKIIHETPALNTGKNVESQILTVNGEKKYVKVIHYTLSDGSLVYDLPMLNPDAINVLYEIIRRAKNDMPAANSSDPYESYDETKTSFIALESALRIGDTESQAAAGFTFILQGVDNAMSPLVASIEELAKEVKDDHGKAKYGNEAIFDSKSLGENKIAIVVRMPRVSGDIETSNNNGNSSTNDSNA